MAATKNRKYDAGGGWFTITVGSDINTTPNSNRFDIVQVKINKHAYDALHANAKADIDAVTLGDLITEAHD